MALLNFCEHIQSKLYLLKPQCNGISKVLSLDLKMQLFQFVENKQLIEVADYYTKYATLH